MGSPAALTLPIPRHSVAVPFCPWGFREKLFCSPQLPSRAALLERSGVHPAWRAGRRGVRVCSPVLDKSREQS